jgi:hypothetical protein
MLSCGNVRNAKALVRVDQMHRLVPKHTARLWAKDSKKWDDVAVGMIDKYLGTSPFRAYHGVTIMAIAAKAHAVDVGGCRCRQQF